MSSSSTSSSVSAASVAARPDLQATWRAFLAARRRSAQADGDVVVQNEPASVFEWVDTCDTGAIGWVVIDRGINGVAGGGIFMHAAATVEETADIARNMSRKFTVTVPQIGGAKAGIRFNHRDPRAKSVLRRFIVDNAMLLRNTWVTAGDLNTDDVFIEYVIQNDLGLPTCQALLARRIAERTGAANLSGQLATLIGTPACAHFPLIEGAVGYGVAAAVEKAWQFVAGSGKPRVVIQGFGAVGSSLAYYLQTKQIADVVAIADKDGFVVPSPHAGSLDIEKLLDARAKRKAALIEADADEAVIKECNKNLLVNLNEDTVGAHAFVVHERTEPWSVTGNEAFLIRFLKTVGNAEVVCPAAGRYQITEAVAKKALVNGVWKGVGKDARLLVSGANNPFGVVQDGTLHEDKRFDVVEYLVKRGTCIVPDWVANSGTAQLFHRGLSVDFGLALLSPHADVASRVLEACAEPIRVFLDTAFDDFAQRSPKHLLMGAEMLAAQRLETPLPMRSSARSNPALSPYALPPLPESARLPLDERERLVRSVVQEVIEGDGTAWTAGGGGGGDADDDVDSAAAAAATASVVGEAPSRDQIARGAVSLRLFLESTPNPVAYDGFEPSGRMHIAQGLMKATIVNRLARAGFTFIFWVADWFAKMNLKCDGDLDKIRTLGHYFIEVWRAAGMDMSRVVFLWASEEFDSRHDEYWPLVLDIATHFNAARVKRCTKIMGRDASDQLQTSQLLYPCMQCADIFFLGVDACQLGLDQRKVNMLAREFVDSPAGRRRHLRKPIILSHPMLAGLKEGQDKMSKSQPDTAIFMEDSAEDVARKIRKAFCPPGEIDTNPIMQYFRLIVFPRETDAGRSVTVARAHENDAMDFATFDEFATAYRNENVHPVDAKTALTAYINDYLEPVRRHFVDNEAAAAILKRVREIQP